MKNKDFKTECPKCGGLKSNSKGKVTKTDGLYSDRRCKTCGHRFTVKIKDLKNNKQVIDNKDIMQNQEEVNIEKDFNEINAYVQTSDCIKSEKELLQKMNIDKSKWFVDSQKIKTWPIPFREGNKQLYSIACNLKKIEPDQQIVPVIQPLKLNVNFDKNVYISNSKHKIKRTIVFADMQIGFERNIQTGELNPFQDRRAIDNLLQTIYDEKPHEILTLGDNLDVTEASKYVKKPEFYFTFQPAIKELGYLMAKIRKLSPTSKIVYLNGNHEIRLDRFINENMLWAYQLKAYNSPNEMLSIDTLLDFKSSNIHFIKEYPGGEYYINNNLKGMHGEFVNLKKEMDETRVSFIMAHIHKIHKLTKTVDDRKGPLTMMGTSIGCLCKIDGTVPGVRKKPNWQNGFISVESTDTHFNLQHIYIDPYGKSICKGKIIQGNDYKDEIKDLLYSKRA